MRLLSSCFWKFPCGQVQVVKEAVLMKELLSRLPRFRIE